MEDRLPEGLQTFADMYRSDEDFQSKVAADPIGVFKTHGITFGDEFSRAHIAVVANTEEVVHLVLPPDPNSNLSDEALADVQGGASASSAGTLGSMGTLACSTIPSCLGSAGTASSAACRS